MRYRRKCAQDLVSPEPAARPHEDSRSRQGLTTDGSVGGIRSVLSSNLFWLRTGLLCFAALLAGGCQTASYYSQAIHGQCQIGSRQRPIKKLLADATTSDRLKRQLALVLELRAFAAAQLGLPANGHYLKYADLERPFAVWNVYAAPEFSVEAKSWWYPVVGRLEYQGYFKEGRARRYAEKLAQRGYDVYVGGVQAYSTLGWFRDPVLNTFIYDSEPELAELLFHELAHQRVFAAGDTDFNEAFATAVAEEGVRRWLQSRTDPARYQAFLANQRLEEQRAQLALRARAELEKLYATAAAQAKALADANPKDSDSTDSKEELRQQKQRLLEKLRADCQSLEQHRDYRADPVDWRAVTLNNAFLNSVDTYYRFLPAFRRLLEQQQGDLAGFYQEVRALAKLKKEARHRRLEASAVCWTSP